MTSSIACRDGAAVWSAAARSGLACCLVALTAAFASVASAGGIAGTVTEADGTTAIEGVYIEAYSWDGSAATYAGWGFTDAAGGYEIAGLSEDDYRVVFYADGAGHLGECYSNKSDLAGADDIAVGTETVSNIDASLDMESHIVGVVTGPDGVTPLPGVAVRAYRWNGASWDSGWGSGSDGSGAYDIGGLVSGTYRVGFNAYSEVYLPEYYSNAADEASADDVVLGTATTVSNIDASLSLSSHIAGTVTGADGVTPLSDVEVHAYRWSGSDWAWSGWDSTAASGGYDIGGLVPGTYHVFFGPYTYAGLYLEAYYSNRADEAMADDVVVPPSATVSNINASLDRASRIAGTVTGPDGVTPLANIDVEVYGWTGSSWGWVTWAGTDASGTYNVGNLRAGTYRVGFQPYAYSGLYLPEYYSNKTDVATADDVLVGPSATATNIDAELELASHITGVVTESVGADPIAGVHVDAYRWNGAWGEYAASGVTDADGAYDIGALRAGTYRVGFYGDAEGYLSEFYSNVWVMGDGADIGVGVSATVSNIDAQLDLPASVSGTVRSASSGLPITNLSVWVALSNVNFVALGTTDQQGRYRIGDLRPGVVYVVASAFGPLRYLPEWYGGPFYVHTQSEPPAGAIPVPLAVGQNAAPIDFDLDAASSLRGTVTVAQLPVGNAEVRMSGQTNGMTYSSHTDGLGGYRIDGLMPDAYRVKASAPRLRDEYWNEAHHSSDAALYPIGAGEERRLDFDLAPGQSPALVDVTSDPPGALVYLDYQPTTNVTPALLDVGEVADVLSGAASHTITVRKPGRPHAPPLGVDAIEAETVPVHFDLTSDAAGDLSIDTSPTGAEVYVDYADAAFGRSPAVVTNFAPGLHTVLVRKPGTLQPRPVQASVTAGATTSILLPLAPPGAPALEPEVRSVPPQAAIYLDYLPVTNVTDAPVGWLSEASPAGADWWSASHTVLLRKTDYLPAAPRYVPESPVRSRVVVHLIGSSTAIDGDLDGLPDEWEGAYRLALLAPGQAGADDDPDHDGLSNTDEMLAGTDPLDPGSGLEVEPDSGLQPDGQWYRLVFRTVPERLYLVQGSADLDGGWLNLSPAITAGSYLTEYWVQLPPGTGSICFRVLVLP